jgi:hypothetical protein
VSLYIIYNVDQARKWGGGQLAASETNSQVCEHDIGLFTLLIRNRLIYTLFISALNSFFLFYFPEEVK